MEVQLCWETSIPAWISRARRFRVISQSEGIRLVHQTMLDLGSGMVFTGNGGASVTCDSSLLVTFEKHLHLCWNVRAADFSVPEAGPSIPVVPNFSGKMEEYKRFRARIPRSKN
jgi:hypothetical protein